MCPLYEHFKEFNKRGDKTLETDFENLSENEIMATETTAIDDEEKYCGPSKQHYILEPVESLKTKILTSHRDSYFSTPVFSGDLKREDSKKSDLSGFLTGSSLFSRFSELPSEL